MEFDPSAHYHETLQSEDNTTVSNINGNSHSDNPLTKSSPPQRNPKISIFFSVYVLLLLLFISISNIASIYLVSVMLPYMKTQLHMNDEQIGLLNGPAYYVVSCIFALLLKWLSERVPRKFIIVGSTILSSIILSITGLSWTYWYLLLCRLAFAAIMSGAVICSVPFLTDLFPPRYRGSMQSVYNSGIFIGVGVEFAMGGVENSDSQNSDMWRYVFYFFGIPAILVALLLLITVKEPTRGALEDIGNIEVIDNIYTGQIQKRKLRQYTSTLGTFLYLAKCPTFIFACLGAGFRAFCNFALSAWLPQFFIRDLGIDSVTQAKWLSWIVPLGGISGFILTGFLTDIWSKRDIRASAYVAFFGALASIPCVLGVLLIENPLGSFFFMFPNIMIGGTWAASAGLIVLNTLPVSMRTMSYTVFFFSFSIVGSFGPLLIGTMTTRTKLSLKQSMAIILSILSLAATCFFLIAIITLRRDIDRKNVWERRNAVVEETSMEDMNSTTTSNPQPY